MKLRTCIGLLDAEDLEPVYMTKPGKIYGVKFKDTGQAFSFLYDRSNTYFNIIDLDAAYMEELEFKALAMNCGTT